MCDPATLVIAQTIGAGLGAVGAAKSLLSPSKTPSVVQQSPAVDAAAADTASAQAAAEKKLQQRRAARANSLLSAAGAPGDGSDPLTQAATAAGKTALGA